MPTNANARAAVFMMLSMTAFMLNDAIAKWLTTEMGVGQTMLLRGLIASALLTAICLWQGAFKNWRVLLKPAVIGRSFAELGGTITYLVALPFLPLSNVSAIYQVLPLVVTMGAAVFLGEPVGWRRWLAIIVGFGGVMLIVQPGTAGFSIYSIIVLISVFFSTARDLVTRRMPENVSTYVLALFAAVLVTIAGGAMVPFEGGFQPVNGNELLGLIVGATLLLIANATLIISMRMGDVSFVAPFRYVNLVVAIIVGYFFFNEYPDRYMLIGASVVVASGVYMFYRERIRAAEKAQAL